MRAGLELAFGTPCRRPVFIDTETTGLAGGTGTLVFISGWVELHDDALELTQLVLEDPDAEAAFMAQTLAPLTGEVVSYNGASFDLPLLETRAVMNRLDWDRYALDRHLDLLPVVRRLFRHRLDDCALATVERRLLGRPRWNDVNGWDIPRAFYRHLDGDSSLLDRVLAHHRMDLLALVDLCAHLASHLDVQLALPHPGDELARARHLLRHGRREQALVCLERAWSADAGAGDAGAIAGLALARLLVAMCAPDRALEVLTTERRRGHRSAALGIALAKLLEHRGRRPAQALVVTEEALAGPATSRQRQDLLKRRERLRARLNRTLADRPAGQARAVARAG
ncbi:MAG: ribonuclease H-like domain-containing protein [Candidatus Dormibacteria bacterium]